MKKMPILPAARFITVALIMLFSRGATFAADAPFGENVQFRGSLENCRLQFLKERKGTVAFLGGSITEMNGYRPMVCDILRRRFPQTDFKFINAGISSTCSTTGAFRLASDIGPVDLLFVEFAVNDDQDAGHTRVECIRGMEGIVRHARLLKANVDVVITHFVNEGMLQTLQSGKIPLTIEAHETVAVHYDVPTIRLAEEVAAEIAAGKLTWQQYGGVHPAPYGNAICASMIDELLNRAWHDAPDDNKKPTPHSLPAPLDPLNYERGRFIDPKEARAAEGWTLGIPDWSHLPGGKRDRFTSIPMLCATEPGKQMALDFEGTAVGAYVVAGPDAGIVEASVDGGEFRQVDLYHHFSAGLHYPRTVLFATDLKPGKHSLTLRVSAQTHSAGHAVRAMQFVAN